eukprot:m.62228 g.62228  ORF g.62228 m.62228 type:complete len:276 (+) comp23115_c0_seq1:279-1106(+)
MDTDKYIGQKASEINGKQTIGPVVQLVEKNNEQLKTIQNAPTIFIDEIGQKLRLSAMVIATAKTLFHRFQRSPSRDELDLPLLCLTLLYIAAKIEETPRDLRDVITTGYTSLHNDDKMLRIDKLYRELRESMISCEQLVLRALGFQYAVNHPHRILLLLLRSIEIDLKQQLEAHPDPDIMKLLAKKSWAVLCDSFRIPLCIEETPDDIAAACVFVASIILGIERSFKLLEYVENFVTKESRPKKIHGMASRIRAIYQYQDQVREDENDMEMSNTP